MCWKGLVVRWGVQVGAIFRVSWSQNGWSTDATRLGEEAAVLGGR